MTLEGRKDNTYYDQTGRQILAGDLLKVFHFKSEKISHYIYLVVVMEESQDFPVMAMCDYWNPKPYYRMYVAADNEQRVYKDAEIIAMKDNDTERKQIEVI